MLQINYCVAQYASGLCSCFDLPCPCVQRLVNEWVLRFNCFENLAVQVWGESLMAYVQMGLPNVTLHSSGGLVSVTHFLFFSFFF